MIKIVNAEQMRELDRLTIEDVGISSITLMENAGMAVVEAIKETFPNLSGKRISVFAGKGNNGGDGFVIARGLSKLGSNTTVYLVGNKDEIVGDAKTNMESLLAVGGSVKELSDLRKLKKFKLKFMHSSVVVDALLGTGFKGTPSGLYKDVIELINNIGVFTVSADLPSGMNPDTGVISGSCVKADLTVTLGLPKVALVTSPARNFAGKISIADISIPELLITQSPSIAKWLQHEDISEVLPPRKRDAHKGQFGHLVISGGSPGLGGAIAMAGMGALRMGVGLVTAAVPKCLAASYVTTPAEMMTLSLEEDSNGAMIGSSADKFLEFAADKTAVLLGPGLAAGKPQQEFVYKLLSNLEVPVIIDADGLNCIGANRDLITNRAAPTIITPHPREMARLVETSVDEVQADRINVAKEYASCTGSVVVLKGSGTVIAPPDGDVYVNQTGNDGLATGGSGDVLSGMIAGLLAGGSRPEDAAIASVYIHGHCADIYAKDRDTRSMLPSDILEMLPKVLHSLNES